MEPIPEFPPLTDLITSLEHATLMSKQLPNTTDSSHLHQIYSSFQTANHQLTSFLSRFQSSQPPQTLENSVSSAIGGVAGGEDEPMQIGDDGEEEETEENSRIGVEKVEERLKNCVIQNKRRKRRLSPTSAVVEQRREIGGNGVLSYGDGVPAFDPLGTRLRSLDLVFQFHG